MAKPLYWCNDEVSRFLQLYQGTPLKIKDIAARMRCSRQTVYRMLERFGVPRHQRRRQQKYRMVDRTIRAPEHEQPISVQRDKLLVRLIAVHKEPRFDIPGELVSAMKRGRSETQRVSQT